MPKKTKSLRSYSINENEKNEGKRGRGGEESQVGGRRLRFNLQAWYWSLSLFFSDSLRDLAIYSPEILATLVVHNEKAYSLCILFR